MEKREIVRVLEEMALILQIQEANPFRVRAFVNGAQAFDDWEGDLPTVVAEGRLTEIHGIGKGLSAVIADLFETGHSEEYQDLRGQLPAGLLELKQLPGVGPKKIKALHEMLEVDSIADLEAACREGRVRALKGFGAKTEEDLLRRIERHQKFSGRHRVPPMARIAEAFRAAVAAAPGVVQLEVAGSLRRRRETIGDIDLLVSTTDPTAAREAFLGVPGIHASAAEGETKLRVEMEEDIGVDLRIVAPESFAAALHYFTGNKEHNTQLRGRARERGWKLNEYGLYDEKGNALPLAEEADVFRHLGLAWVPPELREGQDEVARAESLEEWPPLIEESDLRGVLHVHTTDSDGESSLEELVEAARARGWSYLGISDHSRSSIQRGGLSIDRLQEQGARIDALNAELDDLTVLRGVECDILVDGSLDYPDEILAELDFVVISVHSDLNLPRDEQTKRIEAALRNPHATIWGHPSNRLLLRRDPVSADLDALLRVAAEEGVIVEVNASPRRLDLDWRWGPRARELGVEVGIFPDAHSVEGLDNLQYGIGVARKAGFSREHVVNHLPLAAFRERLSRRRDRAK